MGLRARERPSAQTLAPQQFVALTPRHQETALNSAAAIYDLKPWLEHYGTNIPRELGPLRHAHLPALLRATAERYAAQVAFTTCMPNGMHGSLTFGQVDALSDDFAVYLRQVLGLAPGARVAIQTPNCLAYPVVAFGILKADCVLVNINPLYTPAEMEHQFADSGAEALVIVDMFANKLEGILKRTAIRRVIVAEVSQFFSPVPRAVIRGVMKMWNQVLPKITVGHVRLAAALAEGAAARQRERVDVAAYLQAVNHAALAVLQYTGGTTGVGKGAMLTHGNLLHNIEQALAMGRSHVDEGKEVVLTALPLYHIFAFTFNLLCFYAVGAHNVLVPNPRPIQNLQRAFDNYPVTWVSGVNTLFNALLNEEWFTAFPPEHLKAAVAGGTSLQHAVADRWQQITGTPIAEGYGLTETSPVVSFNPIGGTRKPDSIGIPAPGTEVRLVDDQGVPVALGEPGELIVRGPQVMAGYWQRPDETAKAIRDGWLYTGDVAVMDKDGYFRIVDRKKDMILVSGFNVYPNEVEDAIALMDEVLEVGVIGVPDSHSGEAVRAYIVAQQDGLTEERVRAHCKTLLTDYKRPKSIEFRKELPKTPVGKILRKDLKADYQRQTQTQTQGKPA
ncbi:MAG: AMP-binding protein [Hydrogenophaga sp.]|nr:AMP-binding protein [Hydrogenophaga sp.]